MIIHILAQDGHQSKKKKQGEENSCPYLQEYFLWHLDNEGHPFVSA